MFNIWYVSWSIAWKLAIVVEIADGHKMKRKYCVKAKPKILSASSAFRAWNYSLTSEETQEEFKNFTVDAWRVERKPFNVNL
jgi:hypothetical protein